MNIEYKVIKSKRKSMSIEINKEGEVTIRTPLWMPEKEILLFVNKHASWIMEKKRKIELIKKENAKVQKLTEEQINELKNRAKKYIPERVSYYAPIVGVTYGKISIKAQKTIWGSCSTKGNLNFNCMLMMMPDEVIDSVIVHELCHRKYMDHSRRFYNEVLRVFPEYKKCNKWLKENGNRILTQIK